MRLRMHGTREEIAEATRRLVEVLEVVSVSQPYPDRGASVLVRVYLEVRLDPASLSRSSGASRAGSAEPAGPATRAGRRPRRQLGGRWSG
jgi:hypothetical protein